MDFVSEPQTRNLRYLAPALLLLVLLLGPLPSFAEDAAKPQEKGLEINLDALKGLNDTPVDQNTTPEEDAKKDTNPPALTPAPDPVQKQALPQSPNAPQVEPTTPLTPTSPADKRLDGKVVTLLFEDGIENLTLEATDQLDQIATKIADTPIRLQLFAYAGVENDSPSATRRLALRRAIATRGYLMDKGINGTRIDLRPVGPETGDNHPERIDVTFVAP